MNLLNTYLHVLTYLNLAAFLTNIAMKLLNTLTLILKRIILG